MDQQAGILAGPETCLGFCEHVMGVVHPQFCAGLCGESQDVPGWVASRWMLAGGRGLGGGGAGVCVPGCWPGQQGQPEGSRETRNPERALSRWGTGQDGY